MAVGSFVLLLAALPAVQLPTPPPASPDPTVSPADEKTLMAANLVVAGPALLDFLHKRTGPAVDKTQLASLIKQLADPAARDAASGQLVALGESAVPALREAANNLDDPEFAGRARQCLQNIEGVQGANLSMAVVRAAAALRPPGAAEGLLEYLPFAENDKVEQEVETALAAVALRDGKPEAGLVRALADPTAIRRAAAAAALCRVGGTEQFAAVRVLLKDPKPTVRFRAAMALADAYSADGVPVLIDLLAELPLEQRKQAEEYLTTLAGEWAVVGPAGNDATSRRLRRETWAAWWRGIDDEVLLDEFKTRTMTDDERDLALALIQKLDDVSADVREKASTDLVGMGLRVTPLLRQAAVNPNPRIGPFALKCLQLIEKESPNPLPAAAGRMLALRAPDGAVATLLAYLPYADNDAAAQQMRDLLASLAVHDAKAVPVLLKALDDKIGVRRSAAAVALSRLAGRSAGDNLPAVKKLFNDPDVDVRLRTALAVLTAARDKDAVPVLIALLADLPPDRVWEDEETLAFLAGDKAPAVSVVGDADARKKARDAWATWWADNNAAVDLTKLDLNEQRELGYLLVVEMNSPKGTGRVLEQDAAGKVRWQVENLLGPLDAQATPGNRVLIIDNNGQRVSERETATNKILWEKNVNQAFRVQRLSNGNTFVACHNQLLEYDRNGKEVFNQPRPEYLIDAQKMRDGQTALMNNQGGYTRLDAAGKELKTLHIPFNFNLGVNGGAVLPNDHVILTSWNSGKVYEYDGDGKTVLDANVQQANSFFRMANGHTLVTCQNQTHVVELDQAGKVVNEIKDLTFRPYRVSRR